jgi:hypothetical protein
LLLRHTTLQNIQMLALRWRRGTACRCEWVVEVSGGKILWRWN